MIFWLVLKLGISYRVVSYLKDVFEDYIFAW